MTTTLGEIHQDPRIIDRAIATRERLDIVSEGQLQATLVPAPLTDVQNAQAEMRRRFAAPDWNFQLETTMTREERNARG